MNHHTRSACLVLAALAAACGTAHAQNVVINGDFEAGNTGFTTAYSFAPSGNSTEGEYTIRSNPAGWNGGFQSTGDHTSGSGLMMVVNGQNLTTPILMWGQTVNVAPGKRYTFSMWVRTVVDGPSAILLATINGTDLTPGYVAPQQFSAGWTSFSREWVADAPTAAISIKNLNIATFPNDFVIDDIALIGASCPADLNADQQVDDADFQIFVVAYDILDCADASMPAGCPSDLTGDALVDDADFQLFVLAYNELLCP